MPAHGSGTPRLEVEAKLGAKRWVELTGRRMRDGTEGRGGFARRGQHLTCARELSDSGVRVILSMR